MSSATPHPLGDWGEPDDTASTGARQRSRLHRPRVPDGAVVVGVDGSDPSLDALRWAARIADRRGLPLVVLHAFDAHPSLYAGLGAMVPPLRLEQELDRAGEAVLHRARRLVHELRPQLSVTLVLSEDDPREALVRAGRAATLLVVAARGVGAMAHLLLGSVSGWVAQHGSCPVVVVRGKVDEAGELPQRLVVVGADGTSGSDEALDFALAHAARDGLDVRVVRCVAAGVGGVHRRPEGPLPADCPERVELEAAVAVRSAGHQGVPVTLDVRAASPAGYLTQASVEAGLLVLGSHEHHGPGPWGHGAVRRSVLEHAQCPVAVVPGRRPEGEVASGQ